MIVNHVIACGIVFFYLYCVAIIIYERIGKVSNESFDLRIPRNDWIIIATHTICLTAAYASGYFFLAGHHVFSALLVPAACLLASRGLSLPKTDSVEPAARKSEAAAMILFTIISAAVSLFRIDSVPVGLNTDEIEIAADLSRMLDGRMRLLDVFGFGVPRISYAPLIVLQHILPYSRMTIRSWELLCGVACIPVFYKTARLFLTFRSAFLATGILIFLPYHMFYNRILFGSHLTLLELLVIYFMFTAIRCCSTRRLLIACMASALLLYDYEAGRIAFVLLLSILMLGLLNRSLSLRRWAVWTGLAVSSHVILLLPMILVYRRAPSNLFFHRTGMHLKTDPSDLLAGLRQSIRMFVDVTRGDLEIFTHPTSPILLLPVAALLIFGCLSTLLRAPLRSGLIFWGAGFFIALLPSVLTNPLVGNSHRTMMVIPFIPVLIVYGFRELAAMTRCRQKVVWAVAGVAMMLGQAVWGLSWFINDVWNMAPPLRELFYRSSEIRTVEEAVGIARESRRVLISPRSKYIDYAGRTLDDPGQIGRLNAKTWLPENGDAGGAEIVLSDYFDAGIIPFFGNLRFGYHLAESRFPEGVRLLAGRFDPQVVTAGEQAWRQLAVVEGTTLRFSGSLMLSETCDLVMRKRTSGSEIAWDRDAACVQGVSFRMCAGLHAVDITAPSDITASTDVVASTDIAASMADIAAWNPAFEFDLIGCETGTNRSMTVTPAILYTIPVHGWRHRIYTEADPGVTVDTYIDPYLYKRDHWEEHPKSLRDFFLSPHVREWSSRVRLDPERSDPLVLQWSSGQVEVILDGQTIVSRNSTGEAFIDPGTGTGERTLVIRLFTREPRLDIRLLSASDLAQAIPPYEMLRPAD